MLKNRLKTVLVILISVVFASGLSTYATYTYLSKDISYKKLDGTEISVEDALNELYNSKEESTSKNVFVAFYTTRLYSTSYVNIDVQEYNSNMIKNIDNNVITIKESGKYKLDFVSFYGYGGFTLYSNYIINANTTSLSYSTPVEGHYIISESVEVNLETDDAFSIQSKMSTLTQSVGTVSAVLYKID